MLKTGCPRQGLDSVLYVTLSSSNIMVFFKSKDLLALPFELAGWGDKTDHMYGPV